VSLFIILTFFSCFQNHRINKAIKNDIPLHTAKKQIRGRSLFELEVNLSQYGIRRWAYPIKPKLSAGSPYGYRIHPISGKRKLHQGQDIPCRPGTLIRAAAAGRVIVSKKSSTAGKYIEIEHNSKSHRVTTRYMHMRVRHLRVGEEVIPGQIIGSCGNTGNSTGPHLHFEVKIDGQAVPPFVYIEGTNRNRSFSKI
jgi:murein DD-endopeptidase MepM/ murein hydrolase activator NlpD